MAELKKQWNFEMALEVLSSETVDAGLWSEAVKWLLFYGPTELREMLNLASSSSFSQCYPRVRVKGHIDSGQPCYAVADLAEILGVSAETAVEQLQEIQAELGGEFLVTDDQVCKIN
ncbi:MAG: hypothetical protein HGA96_06165 [Desulfobulbaceae bacterium]|nr:hypothetical protein [Desulfobulbaceae bacterium]